MAWRIEFESAAAKELRRLDPQVAGRILKFLRERVAPLDDPRSLGEALKGTNSERSGNTGWATIDSSPTSTTAKFVSWLPG